jgi:DNA end-binding protein Ku
MYYEKPYYVVPADDFAEDAFIVLRDALRKSKKIGIGQLAMRGQEYVVALKPCGKGMLLETLRYADEVHKANSYFREIEDKKPDEDMLDLANMLIEKKAGEFDASEFHNRYVDALRELIAEKQRKKGEKIIQDPDSDRPPERGGNVVDLMAALKKSLETAAASPARPSRKPAARSKSSGTTKKKAAAGGRK